MREAQVTATAVQPGAALLPPEIARKLQTLGLGSRTRRAGQLRGERRSTKRGTSVEFADYRSYAPGDDLRRVDWNLYARTDRLFLKLYEEEEDRSVHVIIDTSASMGFGSPTKLDVATRLAASLSYVALHELDRLHVSHLASGEVRSHRPLRGTAATARMLTFLSGLGAGGESALNRSLREYGNRSRGSGLLILISDLLDPNGFVGGLRALGGHGYEIVVLHVLSPEELQPTLLGDFELVDSESADRQPITLDQSAIEAYERRLDTFIAEAKHMCSSLSASYNLIRSDTPVEELLFDQLRTAKVLV